MTHPFIPPSFARLSRWQRREQAILKLGRLPVVSGTELEARGDTLGEQTRAQVPGVEGGEPRDAVPGIGSDRAVLDTSQRAAIPGPAPSGQRGGGVTARPVVR